MGKTLKKKKFLIPIILISTLIAIFAVCAIVFKGSFNGKSSNSGGMKLEKDAVEWDQTMKSSDQTADIQIPYYSDIYMAGGSDEIEMYLVNPKENECYFTYTFLLADSNEQIYQSGLIEPGKALEQVKLDRKMGSGEYALKMRIDTYALDSKTALNNAIVSTKLIAQQ